MRWKQRTSAFSSSVGVATCLAFSKQVEAEKSRNEEPQPLGALSLSRTWLPSRRRLRFSELLQRTSAFSSSVVVANLAAIAEKVEV